MKLMIFAKFVPDTYGKRGLDLETGMVDRVSEAVIDEIDERVAEAATQFKNDIGADDTEIIAVTMGPDDASQALRKVLAIGADRAVHIVDDGLAGSDLVQTARVLAAVVEREGADLVLTGAESTDGQGGMLAAAIAQLTGRPVAPSLDEATATATGISGVQRDGTTETTLSVQYPAVVSLTEKIAEPRLPNFKAIRAAKKKPQEQLSLAELDLQAGPEAAYVRSTMVSAAQRPARTAGPKVPAEDNAVKQLVDFLAERHVI
ncbi:electron transfer flavoprotein subunit beta/FixA family protein [Auritidibacter ignavus]|uniref:electron transfer flavoprotein subunit beta/FixA family protein n=1 Tax=Auritidibacter ignavus TaxID=678932 RepID=UPI002FE697F2